METTQQAARRIVHEATLALARRGDRHALRDLERSHPSMAEAILRDRQDRFAFRARVMFGLTAGWRSPSLLDVAEA